jgi:hypothetical protein
MCRIESERLRRLVEGREVHRLARDRQRTHVHTHDGEASRGRRQRAQDLEPLRGVLLVFKRCGAGDVPARPCEAVNEPIFHRVGSEHGHDWNCLGRPRGRPRRFGNRDQHLGIPLQQLGRQLRQAVEVSVGIAPLDDEVPAFDQADAAPQRHCGGTLVTRDAGLRIAAGVEDSDAAHRPAGCRLRPRVKRHRRGECGRGAHEGSTLHVCLPRGSSRCRKRYA